jgi:hypothetical protein
MVKKEKPYRQCEESNGSQDTTKKEKESQYEKKERKNNRNRTIERKALGHSKERSSGSKESEKRNQFKTL